LTVWGGGGLVCPWGPWFLSTALLSGCHFKRLRYITKSKYLCDSETTVLGLWFECRLLKCFATNATAKPYQSVIGQKTSTVLPKILTRDSGRTRLKIASVPVILYNTRVLRYCQLLRVTRFYFHHVFFFFFFFQICLTNTKMNLIKSFRLFLYIQYTNKIFIFPFLNSVNVIFYIYKPYYVKPYEWKKNSCLWK